MKHEIELEAHQVDEIVIQELQQQYKILSVPFPGDEITKLDYELLKAINLVLAFYMKPDDYEEWTKYL